MEPTPSPGPLVYDEATISSMAAQRQQEAAKYETGGSVRIERPVTVEVPEPAPEPVMTLPVRFAPFAGHFAQGGSRGPAARLHLVLRRGRHAGRAAGA